MNEPSSPPDGKPFLEKELASEMNVSEVHDEILHERHEPREGAEPINIWFVVFIWALSMWGGMYLAFNSGGFRANVFDPPRAKEAKITSTDPRHAGERLFIQYCAFCHQRTGLGVPGIYPPLAGSEWVLSRDGHTPEQIIRIVLHGVQGPLSIKGQQFNNSMVGWGGVLKDHDVAAILNYIRSEWGNDAPPIDPALVGEVRSQEAGRVKAWTEPELRTIHPVMKAASP